MNNLSKIIDQCASLKYDISIGNARIYDHVEVKLKCTSTNIEVAIMVKRDDHLNDLDKVLEYMIDKLNRLTITTQE